MGNMVALTYIVKKRGQRTLELPAIEWDHNYCRVLSWSTELEKQFRVSVSDRLERIKMS